MAVFRKMLLIGLGMLAMSAVNAERGSFVKSIPQAIPSKNLFQVNIDRIDAEQPSTFSTNLPVKPGTHTLVVRIEAAYGLTNMKDVVEVSREMTLEVEEGATYLIAGEINPDATSEQQRAGDYWKPVIHKVVK
ncbi:MAG: hypothetical protein OES78_10675 [Chromatiales bacterium]|jgi:hypothetical protein|nr:hypothetical protein [Chromatiales bacterium]MDH3945158.1 hypothetical protein [Chromatiales bacterium]MDH4015081.1 hypothetical protein [Chromatiales bacterium]